MSISINQKLSGEFIANNFDNTISINDKSGLSDENLERFFIYIKGKNGRK